MRDAFHCTAAQLAAVDPASWSDEYTQSGTLVYSSPATLAFNSPGAEGFGVKRASLAIPGSVMLLFSPGCCGRNVSALGGPDSDLGRRTFYLLLDETDIVTGRYLTRIVKAAENIMAECEAPPSAIILCSTCVDALLGTDMDRVCRMATEKCGVPVLSSTMYALTREGRLPPMVLVRKTVYSLLKKAPKRRSDAMNILGFFSPLMDDCELYGFFRKAGIRQIGELSRCSDMDEYHRLSQANFNLVLHPESRHAAAWMHSELGIPSVELSRTYQPEKIHRQYQALAGILGIRIDDGQFLEQARAAVASLRHRHGPITFAIGETCNADPYELALSLLRAGFRVAEIFAAPMGHVPAVRAIAQLSPETRIYSNMSPSMIGYRPRAGEVDAAIGRDAVWHHPEAAGIVWADGKQPFGYSGLMALVAEIDRAVAERRSQA